MTDATMNLKTLIEKTPDADLLREMIHVYRDHMNHDMMVVNTYKEILDLDPENIEAIDALAELYEKLSAGCTPFTFEIAPDWQASRNARVTVLGICSSSRRSVSSASSVSPRVSPRLFAWPE